MKKLPTNRWMSLWRHFFHREKTAAQLTDAMIEWQENCGWDLLKINPAACYHVLDWGADYQFFDDEYREPVLQRPAITSEMDIDALDLPVVTHGVLGEQLQVIRNLRRRFGPELPIVETIFSPIEIAHRMMNGREALLHLLKGAPESLHRLLQKIQSVFSAFALECLQAGADGVFFATKWATADLLTWTQYEEFGKRYELPMLLSLQQKEALLILHVCGAKTYLHEMLDYPADIFSYDFFAEGALHPQEIIARTDKFVLGGIEPEALLADPRMAIEKTVPYREMAKWLIGPSCVVPPGVSYEALLQLKAELCPPR